MQNFNVEFKKMTLALADYIITGDEAYISTYDVISKSIDKKSMPDYIDPSSPNSEDIKIERSFESVSIALSEVLGISANDMTIMQFYSAVKHIEEKNKAIDKIMDK